MSPMAMRYDRAGSVHRANDRASVVVQEQRRVTDDGEDRIRTQSESL